jgi:hypothetical protein
MRGYYQFAASKTGTLIAILLSAAFLICSALLAWHVIAAPEFEVHVTGELLLVAVLSLEGVIAVRHLGQARLDSLHQVLINSRQQYGSAEMMLALVTLWKFRREHGDAFVRVYLDRWRADEDRIVQLPPGEQLEAMRGTLHYHRRIVKEFYNSLAGLYELELLPKATLYNYWSEAELAIIPEILIPLEMAVARELRSEKDLSGWILRLRRLYEDRYS